MQNAEKVSVTMTPDMVRALRESVEAGEFATISEAMRDAVRVWQRQRLEYAERLEALRARAEAELPGSAGQKTTDRLDVQVARCQP